MGDAWAIQVDGAERQADITPGIGENLPVWPNDAAAP